MHLVNLSLDVDISLSEFLHEPLREMIKLCDKHHLFIVEIVQLLPHLVQLAPQLFIVLAFLGHDLLLELCTLGCKFALLLTDFVHQEVGSFELRVEEMLLVKKVDLLVQLCC